MADRHALGSNSSKEQLCAEIARQNKVIQALTNRLERGATSSSRSDFDAFQTTIVLEHEVRRRTAELEHALRENERMTRALKESEEKLQSVVNQPLVGIATIENDKFTFMNAKFAEIFGYAADELIGAGPLSLAVDEDKPKVAEQLYKRLNGEVKSVDYTFRGLKKNGAIVDIELHGSIMNSGKKPVAVSVALDVGERQRAEQEYTRLQQEDGATQEFGRTPLDGGSYVMTVQDITDRLQAESKRSLLEKELIQAQRLESLGTLASGIAHEINTPIQYVGDNIRFISQSLGGLLDILQQYRKSLHPPIDPDLVAEHAEALSDLEKELDLSFILEELPLALDQSAQGVKQVATIVKAIKEFSHPGEEEKIKFDINAIIETTLIVSKNQWKYFAEVETQLDRSLPPISCLPGELSQTLLNLIVNAAHAIETAKPDSGLIRVSTWREGDSVIVEVEDNGCGIPDEIKERIYDPFFTTKDIGKGTGQGLTIAFGAVVNKHGGTIVCVSHPGEGTRFTISLPIDDSAEGKQEDAA